MKKMMFLAGLILACISGTAQAQQFPNIQCENQDGETIETKSLVDGETPFIVSFWSTTCKSCIKELNAIYEVMPDWLDEAKFRVVAVSIDDSRSASRARSMAISHGWEGSFELIYDLNSDFKRALNVTLTPQVFIFDKNGKQVYAHTGYLPGGEAELIEVIKELK
ncbi:MAG: TlpA disulfide reductase family protein [Alistipes sp.]